jgi:large subunit ribosomal protein L30
MSNKKIFVRQVRSTSGTQEKLIRTLKAMGLGKIGKTNLLPDSPAMRGMVRAVVQWLEVKHV